jgi:DNA topoisomerase-1
VAGFFAAMLETDHAQDAKFRENFFRDFAAMVEKYPPVSELHLTQAVLTDQKEGIKVKSLEKCDFKPMFEYFEGEKEKKKSMTAEQKKAYVFRQSHRI